MSKVQVQKHAETSKPVMSLFEDMRKQFDEIQERAFSLFQARGGEDGLDLEDWFRAERELFHIPASDLVEEEDRIRVRAAAPGLQPGDLHVTVTPHELVVQGESSMSAEQTKGTTHYSELSERKLFRRFVLPAVVDPDKTTAKLEDGMLLIEMPKAASREDAKSVEVSAAA